MTHRPASNQFFNLYKRSVWDIGHIERVVLNELRLGTLCLRTGNHDRSIVNFEGNVPAGGLFHVASFSDKGVRVTDLWQCNGPS